MIPNEEDPFRDEREATASLIRDLHRANPEAHKPMTRDELVMLGKAAWEQSYRFEKTDDGAFERMASDARQAVDLGRDGGDVHNMATAASFLYLPMEQTLILWAARWADQGFPVVQMGHKYAAALMATAVTVDEDDVRPPWHAFLILVPSKLLSVAGPSGERHDVKAITVQRLVNGLGEQRWSYVVQAGPVTLWRHGVHIPEMLEKDVLSGHNWDSYSFSLDVDDEDQRTYFLIQRLILNTCLAMSHPANVKPLGKATALEPSELRSSPEPLVRMYQVGKPIKIDCREAIREFASGKKRSGPVVQVLVRGHWKSQPHGPKRAFRKRIWIEPYWRGPEDAPILTRPHEL